MIQGHTWAPGCGTWEVNKKRPQLPKLPVPDVEVPEDEPKEEFFPSRGPFKCPDPVFEPVGQVQFPYPTVPHQFPFPDDFPIQPAKLPAPKEFDQTPPLELPYIFPEECPGPAELPGPFEPTPAHFPTGVPDEIPPTKPAWVGPPGSEPDSSDQIGWKLSF